jgi:hypothetical protein
VLSHFEPPLNCKTIGGGRPVSYARSLRASQALEEFRSVRSFHVEDSMTSTPEFSLDYVVIDLNKKGEEEGTSAPPNR